MNNEDKCLREKLEAEFDRLFSDLEDPLSESDDKRETIILNDENGKEVEFEFLDLISFKGEEYVVLLPVEDCDEAGEVVIVRLEEYGEVEEVYVTVDDDDTLTAVFNIFKDKFESYFNFVD